MSSRRRTLNYQADGGGDAGAERIKTMAEEEEATHKSLSGKMSVQEPTPRAERGGKQPPGQSSWGEHSPGSSWPLGKEYSWRGCSAAGPHSLPMLTLHHHAGMPQTTPLAPEDLLPVGALVKRSWAPPPVSTLLSPIKALDEWDKLDLGPDLTRAG